MWPGKRCVGLGLPWGARWLCMGKVQGSWISHVVQTDGPVGAGTGSSLWLRPALKGFWVTRFLRLGIVLGAVSTWLSPAAW